jgi:hypothetical protein
MTGLADALRRRILDSLTFTEGTIRMSLHSDPPATEDKLTEGAPGHVKDWPIMPEQPVSGTDADVMEDVLLPDPGRRLGHMETEDANPFIMRPDWPTDGLRAFQDLVGRITYKPGYRLRVLDDLSGRQGMGCVLSIQFRQPNTYRPAEVIELAQNFHVPAWLLERWGELAEARPDEARMRMMRYVRKALGWHELHERDEWIRVDGTMVFDPHAEGGPSSFRLDA